MLSIPNQLEGAYIGQDVTLECHTEAYPNSINYWTTERGDMIVSGNFKNPNAHISHNYCMFAYNVIYSEFKQYKERNDVLVFTIKNIIVI